MQTIEVEDETWNRLAREGKKEELNVEEYVEKLVQVVDLEHIRSVSREGSEVSNWH